MATGGARGLAFGFGAGVDHGDGAADGAFTLKHFEPFALHELGEFGDVVLLDQELELGASTLFAALVHRDRNASTLALVYDLLDVAHAAFEHRYVVRAHTRSF